MTIAIAGLTATEFIVTVSDARISHGEAIPAADDGTMKNRKIASTWGMMFAASDASAFIPVVSSDCTTRASTQSNRLACVHDLTGPHFNCACWSIREADRAVPMLRKQQSGYLALRRKKPTERGGCFFELGTVTLFVFASPQPYTEASP